MKHNNVSARWTRTAAILLVLGSIACNVQGCSLLGLPGGPTAVPTVDIANLPPVAPQLIEQRPYPGEELPLDGSIDLYFDQSMDQASVVSALRIDPALDVDMSWIDDSTLSITPKPGQLARASSYTITIDVSAKSASGLAFETAISTQVETVGYLRVSEVVPADGSGEVAPSSVITVLFNRPVVPVGIVEEAGNLPQPLSISPDVPGAGEWINSSIYQWKPSQPMAGNQSYAVTVNAGLTDQTGGVLDQPFSWSFITLPPGVVTVSPADGEIDRPQDQTVEVEFNQPMDHASTEGAFVLVNTVTNQPAAGTFTWDEDSKIMTFTPTGLLALDGIYQASIGANAHGAANAQAVIGTEISWVFSTVLTPGVKFTDPVDGSADVSSYYGFRIGFNSPMKPTTLRKALIQSNPALPEDASLYYSSYDYTWNVNAALEPSTQYTITLLPGATDPQGNAISSSYTWSFSTGPLDPLVQFNTEGTFGVYDASQPTQLFVVHRNVSKIDFTLAQLSMDEFARITNPNNYDALFNFVPSENQVVRSWALDTPSPLNEAEFSRVPVLGDESPAAPSIYLLIADAPEIEGDLRHIMVVSSANLTFKASFADSLVWLTDLQSGQPVGNAPVTLYNENFTSIANGTTGPDGVLALTTERSRDLWGMRYAIVQNGNQFAVALSQWDIGLQPWDFNVPGDFNSQDWSLYLYTDRPLYRPGQPVNFKGVMRSKLDTTYSMPPQPNVLVEVINDRGDKVFSESMQINEFGTFNGSFTLDENAGLGYYSVTVTYGDLSNGIGFQVAEYRKPEYLVNVASSATNVVEGDRVNITVDAEFFFGGPVSDADVIWNVLSDSYFYSYEGPGSYSFQDISSTDFSFSPESIPGFGTVIANGEGKTGADGTFTFTIPSRLDKGGTGNRLTIEATVRDSNGQEVSGRTEVIVHRGEVYVGVAADTYVATANQQFSASLATVNWDGQPVPNQDVSVQLVEQKWQNVQEVDPSGNTQWIWSVEEISVGSPVQVKTDDQGRGKVNLTAPRGGEFKIRATTRDSRGNSIVSSGYIWITSPEYIGWRQANNSRIDLIADKQNYKPGETAQILIASPFQGTDVKALITVERGSILRHEVISLPSNSYVYKLPVTGDLAPTVYVSVVIVKGVDENNPVPAYRMGLVRIGVEPVEQTVNLTVTPDRDPVGPGEPVTYTVTATDYSGKPVDAEVSLALVDLAALSLASPNSGKIVDYFYGTAFLGVRTAMPMTYLVDRFNQELFDQGKGGGGGGGGGFFDVRSEFKDTAYWAATVHTGAEGKTSVTITLPDNLTTWRMDARAVTQNTLVGQTSIDIIANKPLLIRPQTPRFFVVQDEATVSATINNNSGKDIDAEVTLTAAGAAISGQATQTVKVPDGGRIDVSWPLVVANDAEWVDLTFSVKGGGLEDASKPPLGDPSQDQKLPVYRYIVPETVGTSGQLTDGSTRIEGIALPRTFDVSDARVDVRIDPSLAATTLDALTYLKDYPYDSTESTVSRFLPNALTLLALRQVSLTDQPLEANLLANINPALQRLYAQQHSDGGWGWFVTDESNPTVSAYVIHGMAAARNAGIAVDDNRFSQGIAYLQNNLQSVDALSSQPDLHRQAYLLYVLARAGQPDVSRTVQLYDARSSLQHWARALVAQTLWAIDSTDPRLEEIKADLVSSAILSASGAHWEEGSDDRLNWNTDTRSTAIILDTFALLWPDNDLGPNIARWLMIARRGNSWSTSQETVWALIGLTDWMVATKELDANYDWEFQLNGRQITNGHAGPETIKTSTLVTALYNDLLPDTTNRFMFGRGQGTGRMYYSAFLTAYLPVEQVKPLSRGIIISRQYLDSAGKAVTEGKVGDILTVRLSIIVPNDLHFAVIEDPFPAGAEAINPNLETESVIGERPVLRPDDPLERGWGWWWFSDTELRDEKAVLFAQSLPSGTYEWVYQIRLGQAGRYRVIPPTGREFYMPDVYGRGEGLIFTILP